MIQNINIFTWAWYELTWIFFNIFLYASMHLHYLHNLEKGEKKNIISSGKEDSFLPRPIEHFCGV